SFDLAQSWGIGHKERLDGLVLLIAPNERKVRIEVGIGLEGSFTDELAGQILRESILPQFREGNIAGGIEAGVDRMIAKMKSVSTLPANDNAAPDAKDEAA
ncbi:MAG: TPM domain-containing protein, partial [Sphingorhabdus sp.]|uniref:TPM domain-containing protein n=1 Tax=Sphingorhabdus sp. TaxID=1902408 RepID=UPI003CC1ED58